jgi:membrane protein
MTSDTSDLPQKNNNCPWYAILGVLKDSIVGYFSEGAFFHGAALAYYTLFAFIPIVYLSTSIFGRVVGKDQMQKIIEDLLQNQIGISDTKGLMDFLNSVNFDKPSLFLEIVSIGILLYGCSAFLVSLKRSINEFFNISKKKRHEENIIMDIIGFRFLSVAYLAIFAFIIILLYFLQGFIFYAFTNYLHFKNGFVDFTLEFFQHLISIFSNILIFTIVFKYIHDGFVPIKLAIKGAFVTSVLLFLSQLLIKYYLHNYFFLGNMGIAGSLFIFLAWVHYSAQIVFFGAKFTAVLAERDGIKIK